MASPRPGVCCCRRWRAQDRHGDVLANPWNDVYWSGAAGAVSSVLGASANASALVVLFTGFMLPSLTWCFVCAGGVALPRRALPPEAVRAVELLCGLALLLLAGLLLSRLATA